MLGADIRLVSRVYYFMDRHHAEIYSGSLRGECVGVGFSFNSEHDALVMAWASVDLVAGV